MGNLLQDAMGMSRQDLKTRSSEIINFLSTDAMASAFLKSMSSTAEDFFNRLVAGAKGRTPTPSKPNLIEEPLGKLLSQTISQELIASIINTYKQNIVDVVGKYNERSSGSAIIKIPLGEKLTATNKSGLNIATETLKVTCRFLVDPDGFDYNAAMKKQKEDRAKENAVPENPAVQPAQTAQAFTPQTVAP